VSALCRSASSTIPRTDVPVHRIKAFENDQLHAIATRLEQQLLEMRDIIVPPDFPFAT
jgi:hypothetical protein